MQRSWLITYCTTGSWDFGSREKERDLGFEDGLGVGGRGREVSRPTPSVWILRTEQMALHSLRTR